MPEIHLSVIIPAYNEEKRLPKTLKAVDDYLRRQPYEYEIVVVNGGSTDKTQEVVRSMLPAIKNLGILDVKNLGKGYAVRQGMLKAQGDYRVFMDADNATSLEHVEKMWPEFANGYDVIIGSRDIKGAVIAVSQVWWRRRLGDVFNLIVQFCSGLWGMWDTQCGFKGFTGKAAEKIFAKSVINRWAFDVEVLVLARKMGYKIKEVPVTWVNDPDSKVIFSGMVKMLLEVLQITINMWKRKYD